MAREREKEKEKKRKKSEPLWGEGELKEAGEGEVEITPIHAKEESEIEELKRRLDDTQEALTSIKEVGDKMGGLEDKMGELSSIYEAFISKYTPLEEIRKPLLEVEEGDLEDVKQSVILLGWAEYLLEKLSRKNIVRLLDYYRGVGWIDDELYERTLSALFGVESPPGTENIENWRLSVEDHVKSLLFLSTIKGKEINRNKIRALLLRAETLWKEGEFGV